LLPKTRLEHEAVKTMANDKWTDESRRRWGDDRDRYRERYGSGSTYSDDTENQEYRDREYRSRDYRDPDYSRDRGYRDRSYGFGDRDYSGSRTDYRRQYGRGEQSGRDDFWRDNPRGSDYGYGWGNQTGPYGSGGYGAGYGGAYGPSSEYGDWFGVGSNSVSNWSSANNPSWGRRDYEWRSGQGEQRPLWDRTRDEFRSWMGDREAERRRQMDNMAGGRNHYGRAPRGYTRSDERIREDVNDRLTDDPYVDATDIEVKVSTCEVTLTGTVDSRNAKRRAEDIADGVSGVRHVQNNLRVRESSGMSSSAETPTTTTSSTTTQGKH
jgi:hypothetical protein